MTETTAGAGSHPTAERMPEPAALFPVDDADLDRLHTRLAAAADQEDLLDIAYRTVDSPVGPLLLAATRAGLVRVAFEREGFDLALETLAARIGPRMLKEPGRLDPVATELDEYFAGKRRVFDVPVDHSLSSGFRLTVQRYLPNIGYGRTRSYQEVARTVGNPKAVRAVGTACATNPVPIVVPCHRVLRTDGGLGGYLGGIEAKQALLALEGGT